MRYLSYVLPPLVGFALLLLAWQGLITALGIRPEILPTPGAVAQALVRDYRYLLEQVGVTAAEAGAGLLVGSLAALGIAVLFARSTMIRRAGYPYVIAFKAIPLVVLAPLTELWFPGMASKIVLAGVISFFPVLVAVVDGLERTPRAALALMDTLSASRWQTIAYVRIPHAIPALFSGLRVSSTFAVIGAVVAEFVASDRGIGYVINTTHYYLQTAQTFASVVVAAALGIVFFLAVQILERVSAPWIRREDVQTP